MKTGHTQTFGRRAGRTRASFSPTLPQVGWKGVGVLALLCSGVAWASLPRAAEIPADDQVQWRALSLQPLGNGGESGMRMMATDAVQPVDFVAPRNVVAGPEPEQVKPAATDAGPLRIRGRVGDGLYWSLRAAGAAPDVAARYLAAIATEIDVGEVSPNDGFDMVLGRNRELLYAGLDR
ncbi:MAG TPA: hypothetical protein VM145_05200, partial [Sphingomicrobium sp.]|nr:hypothetical protein [Sphingomicrobium sp.]